MANFLGRWICSFIRVACLPGLLTFLLSRSILVIGLIRLGFKKNSKISTLEFTFFPSQARQPSADHAEREKKSFFTKTFLGLSGLLGPNQLTLGYLQTFTYRSLSTSFLEKIVPSSIQTSDGWYIFESPKVNGKTSNHRSFGLPELQLAGNIKVLLPINSKP